MIEKKNSMTYFFGLADLMSLFILGSLFIVSVICLGIILYKFFEIYTEKKALRAIMRRLRSVKTIHDVVLVINEFEGSAGAHFLKHNLHDIKHILDEKGGQQLKEHDLRSVELMLNQSSEHFILVQEKYISLLGTSAAVAPLVGLFGTIWGLVRAFITIGEMQSANIATIAPGIAQALMTTLAGLVVAIPALIFFNYFSNEIRKIEHYFLSISDTFFSVIQNELSGGNNL